MITRVCSYTWISELAEVRREVESKPLCSSWECHPTKEEDEEHQVGEGSSEVHDLQTHACKQVMVSYSDVKQL